MAATMSVSAVHCCSSSAPGGAAALGFQRKSERPPTAMQRRRMVLVIDDEQADAEVVGRRFRAVEFSLWRALPIVAVTAMKSFDEKRLSTRARGAAQRGGGLFVGDVAGDESARERWGRLRQSS